ncbi:MAG: hypothetical protein M1608_17485 [Candidatus Omnitrophica bacterium]|nr:hypothetical protein [Candidatus Omnitrophota bacterium]
MRTTWLLFCLLWGVPVFAATKTNAVITIYSGSEQFIVQGVPLKDQSLTADASSPNPVLRLDPGLLAVSCERIKSAVLRELEIPDCWRGNIRIRIQFTSVRKPPVTIQSTYFADGWQYRIVLPDEMHNSELVRVIVEALLLEMANRNGGPLLSEIPLWLSEGFTHLLLESAHRDLVLQPFTHTVRLERKPDPIIALRKRLRFQTPLSFSQLSLPAPSVFKSDNWETYQAYAQLLVAELLRLKSGPPCMWNMLCEMPAYLNWQTAFLDAYRNYFTSLLDVEKWWALALVNVNGQNEWHGWTLSRSWDKLDTILSLPAEVRYTTNNPPFHYQITLQQFLKSWDYPLQGQVLRQKIALLKALRINASPAILPLLDAYQLALQQYLDKHDQINRAASLRGESIIRPEFLLHDLLKQLDALDARRATLEPGTVSASNTSR